MRKLLVLLPILLLSTFVSAQLTPHPVKFVKDLESMLSAVDKNEAKAFMERFEPLWESEKVTESDRQKIYVTSNLMIKKRVRTFPDIYNYFRAVMNFYEMEIPKEEFNAWHTSIDNMLNGRASKKLGEYLEMTVGLFEEGKVYETSSHHWLIRGGSYNFIYEKEPILVVNDVLLACRTIQKGHLDRKESPYKDSLVIKATKGRYFPLTGKWQGDGGTLDWAKTGLDPEKNFATIGSYEMSLKTKKVTVDSAVVVTEYYEEPVLGTLVDQAITIEQQRGSYPVFASRGDEIVKKDIIPGVDYYGGLMLRGPEFVGKGNGKSRATLVFSRDGMPFVTARAEEIQIGARSVRSQNAEVSMMINDRDSIFHPGVIIEMQDSLLKMYRGKNGVGQSPFFNTYHNMEMDVFAIHWIRGGSEVLMKKGESTGEDYAEFRSVNYFDKRLFAKYMRQNSENVLVKLEKYCYKYDEYTLPVGQVATLLGGTVEMTEREIYQMANEGFLRYDNVAKQVHVLPKLKDYIEYFSQKKDYDYLVFKSSLKQEDTLEIRKADGSLDKMAVSRNRHIRKQNGIRKETRGTHGILDLRTQELQLFAVEPVAISPIRGIVVIPDSMTLTLTKDRNFDFTGWLRAGEWEVLLDGADFEYDKYLVNLTDVVLARMRVPKFDNKRERQTMTSNIEELHGFIEIDDVTDRSGSQAAKPERSHYPVLHSERESYVYYDHKFVYNGVYDSTRFFFKLEPFVFDSLATFTRSSVMLDGELHSAGIFPVFDQQLTVQTDYSLGFHTQAPSGGYDFYGPDAKYSNEIRLSNRGLRGSGDISYLTSTAVSEDFVFFPDSTQGISQYTNEPKEGGFSVPDVLGKDVLVTYVPKAKVMKAKSLRNPLQFFGKEAELEGYTRITADGMTGRGYMYFGDGQMGSRHYKYDRWTINSDTADFSLANANEVTNAEENPLDMKTTNVNGKVDFQARKGEFRSNDGESVIDFPTNQYICFMDMFTWFMDKDEIELSKDASADVNISSGLDLAGSNFFSVHPEQDSLNFMAPKAKFSRKKKVIWCEEVKYVDVADSRVMPADEKLVIRKKAKIDPLDGATILANNVTKYHTIENSHVEIAGRYAYEASGDYVYMDREDNEYKFHFSTITPDTSGQTVGRGKIGDDAGFKLSPEFDFYGDVAMEAGDVLLQFDGATRINHECNKFERNWMKFSAKIDRENVKIPVGKNLTNLEGEPIAIGIVLGNKYDSLDLYPAFLSAKRSSVDSMLVSAHGLLQYDASTQEYKVGSEEKLLSRSFPGDYVALHTKSCTMDADGILDFGPETKGLTFTPVGRVSYNNATGKTEITASGMLNWDMDEGIMKNFHAKLMQVPDMQGDANFMNTYVASIQRYTDEKEGEKMASKLETGMVQDLSIPKELRAPFYFKDVKFKVIDHEDGLVFMSQGDIGIASVYDDIVYRKFPGYLVIERQRGYEHIHFYLDLPGRTSDYYFHYVREADPGKREVRGMAREEELSIWSSDEEFIIAIDELKEDKKKKGGFSYNGGGSTGSYNKMRRDMEDLGEVMENE